MTDHVAHIIQAWHAERPDLDPSPQGIIGRIHRLGAHLRDELVATYAEFGLGEGDFDVLATLRRSGGPFELRPGDLAERTMVTTGAMTKRIDRLAAAGLVDRRKSDVDGRGRVVALTPRGRDLIDRAFSAHIANEHRLLEPLSAREREQLTAILASWLSHYEG